MPSLATDNFSYAVLSSPDSFGFGLGCKSAARSTKRHLKRRRNEITSSPEPAWNRPLVAVLIPAENVSAQPAIAKVEALPVPHKSSSK
jgi:hypothetical protein